MLTAYLQVALGRSRLPRVNYNSVAYVLVRCRGDWGDACGNVWMMHAYICGSLAVSFVLSVCVSVSIDCPVNVHIVPVVFFTSISIVTNSACVLVRCVREMHASGNAWMVRTCMFISVGHVLWIVVLCLVNVLSMLSSLLSVFMTGSRRSIVYLHLNLRRDAANGHRAARSNISN